MPRKTYDVYTSFIRGLAPYSEIYGAEGTYGEARDIDIHRKPGFIMPGWSETTIAHSSAGVLSGIITDAVIDVDKSAASNTDIYAVDTNAVYHINGGTSLTDTSAWPHTVSNGQELMVYPVSSTNYLWYIQDTDVGRCNLSASNVTFDDDYMSVSANGGAALQDAPHPALEWKSYMWIGNGRYLSKFDGQATGAASAVGQFTEQALDLARDWEITSLFPTRSHIGICANKKTSTTLPYSRTEAAVFMWDGVSEDFNYQIPVADNEIGASLNNGKDILLVTQGRSVGDSLKRLTNTGDEDIKHLKTASGTATVSWRLQHRNAIDTFQGRTLIGADWLHQNVFAYGRPSLEFPLALTQPFSSTRPGSSSEVGIVKQLHRGKIYASYRNDTDKYQLVSYSSGASTNALWRGRYHLPGAKIRVNWVKFFYDPLESGDDITPTLDVDLGTSVTLKDPAGNSTISFTNDGTANPVSKKFYVKKDCRSFRPVLDWTAGDTAFSKIVVDYDFIQDD